MNVALTPSYGAPSVIELTTAPEPTVGPSDLLVEVHASPVTAGDRRLRAADFPGFTAVVGRLLMGITAPRNPIQGTMFAGRVVAVGPDVTRFSVGDDVFGAVDHGAYAERLVVAEDGPVAKMPANVGYDEAAAVPYGAGTALTFLRDVQPGERVLILGASGGVGRYAVQIAKHRGAEVTAVCSPGSFELVRGLGADHVVDHRTQDWRDTGSYDVVFDIADASGFPHARGSLTETGRYTTLYVSFAILFWMAVSRKARFGVAMPDSADIHEVADLLARGVIRPTLAATFPLSRIVDAHALAGRGVHGEVIVQVADQPALRMVG